MVPIVTVIIRTMASRERKESLLRAIESARAASNRMLRFIVVVNGQRRFPELVRALQEMPDVSLVSLQEASLIHALIAGRRAVDTPFYCCLDDDDEFLPGAIDLRVAPLLADSTIDVITSNGYIFKDHSDAIFYKELNRVAVEPLHALFTANWLASCSFMFRSNSIGVSYFENFHPYVEWTWLAFNLAKDGKKISVINQPTFRINDTVGSASKSLQYDDAHESLYQKMLDSNPPSDIVPLIKRRIGDLLHMRAEVSWRSGQLHAAWISHLRSLTYPGGLRYLAFSRYLLQRARRT